MNMDTSRDYSNELTQFVTTLSFDQLPVAVVDRTEELFLDWLASALAAKGQHPIPQFESFACQMGPIGGTSEILVSRTKSSPFFAAWVNAASSHLVEQDDLHNSSVLHPATVIFPVALAVAQNLGSSGKELITAAVAGYEAGIRIGEFLGRSHYRTFHTTGTAGTLAAAVTAGHLLKLSPQKMAHTIGSAGTQAAGLWEFLRDAADSKQLHTAHAAASGLASAYLAREGVTGAKQILEGTKGMASGMSSDADPSCLADQLGSRWALLETSFKYHSSCRHTHPAADALLDLMQREMISYKDIVAVRAGVHQDAINVLGAVNVPITVHQAKFSMGTVLGLIAIYGKAGLEEFRDYALSDPQVSRFREMVTMDLDAEVDAAYPQHWLGRIEVTTANGKIIKGSIDEPKGDPGNTLSRSMLEEKMHRLVCFSKAASDEEVNELITKIWTLQNTSVVPVLLNANNNGKCG